MLFYKQIKTNMIYAYEPEQMSHPIVVEAIKEMTPISEAEAMTLANPPPTTAELAERARAKRNWLLEELDAIVSNPLRWEEFADEDKQALRSYRQELLDVPQQGGFPRDIKWPKVPIE